MSTSDVQRNLEAWLATAEARREPSDLLDSVFAVTRRTGQRRGLLGRFATALEAPIAMPLRLSPQLALVLLTALLSAALVGVALVGGQLLRAPAGPGWRELPVPADAIEGSTYVTGVVAGGPGLVAVGNSLAVGDDGCNVNRAHAWTSTDGQTWQLGTEPAWEGAQVEMVRAGAEYLYAVGYASWQYVDGFQDCSWQAAQRTVWRSTDALSWQPLPGLPGDADTFLADLAEVDGRPVGLFLTADYSEPEAPTQATQVWRLDETWQQVATIADALVLKLAVADGQLVGVGFDDLDQVSSRTWSSADGGTTWLPGEALPDGARLFGLTVRDGLFVAVGELGTPLSSRPLAMRSEDGRNWLHGSLTDPDNGDNVLSVWATGAGFIALGTNYEETAEPTACPPAPYQSAEPTPSDGASPTQSPAQPPTGVAASFEPSPSCTQLRGGNDAWISADGQVWRRGPFVPASDPARPIADPIPAQAFSVAGSARGLAIAHTGFGGRIWFIAAADLIP